MPTYNFPSIAVSEKEKQKSDYYKTWVESVVCNTFTSSWTTNYNKMMLLYNFIQDGTPSNLTGYLQQAPDGSAMPGVWATINNCKTRMKTLVGELEERGYIIKARALNTEAEARKLEEKERLRIKRKLQGLRSYAEQTSGIPLEKAEYVPQTDEELKEYMDLSWKDKNVLILEGALKWIAKRSHWDDQRVRNLWNVLITNVCAVRNEIIRGVPTPRTIDPLKFIFDPNATDDLLSDAAYFGEVEYLPLATAAERYGLTLEELQECYTSYQSYLGLGMGANAGTDTYSWGCMPNQALRWFRVEDGTPRCLVIKAVWKDYKQLANKFEENEEKGSVHFQDVSRSEKIKKKDEDKIIYNKIECWRQGTLVGGKFLKEWGECPNQARDLSSLQISECPYKVWIPEFFNGKFVSLVEQQVGLALLKDIAVYQLQIQMARAVGKVLVFDEAMMPEGFTRETVIRYIKADGVAFVNSREYQQSNGTMNLFKDYDIGLSESIGQGIQLIEYFDRQLDQVTGINQERQGQVQGASQAVGTTNAALFQSNLITAPLFRGFERWCSRVLNNQAKLVKVAWAGKEVFAPIIGDVGVDFLRDNIDLSLDEFDVFVESLPPNAQQRQTLINMLNIIVQSDPAFAPDAMDILLETDTTVAIRKYQRKAALRQLFLNQQEQQQAAQEQELAQQQMMMQQRGLELQGQQQVQLQQMKNQGNLQKTLVTGRVKLQGQKLDLLKQ